MEEGWPSVRPAFQVSCGVDAAREEERCSVGSLAEPFLHPKWGHGLWLQSNSVALILLDSLPSP